MKTLHRSDRGFTLFELMLAVALFAVGSATAVVVTASTMTAIRADGQSRRLIATMRLGRELAISTRRDHQLTFDLATNNVTLSRLEGGLPTVVESFSFEYSMVMMQYENFGDTPDGYGADEILNFGGASQMVFEPDGSFVDETRLPLNGTVFLGIPGQVSAARAVSITGTTARPRLYEWDQSESTAGSWTPR